MTWRYGTIPDGDGVRLVELHFDSEDGVTFLGYTAPHMTFGSTEEIFTVLRFIELDLRSKPQPFIPPTVEPEWTEVPLPFDA